MRLPFLCYHRTLCMRSSEKHMSQHASVASNMKRSFAAGSVYKGHVLLVAVIKNIKSFLWGVS